MSADKPEDGGETNWEDAMRELRLRARSLPEADVSSYSRLASSREESVDSQPTNVTVDSGGFKFERAANDNQIVAGLDRRDEALLRNAYLIGGRLLTAVTILSLAFYIYVGATGGITDGFDRFSEPIEDIRVTMERERADGPDLDQLRAVDGLFRMELVP